MSDDEREQATDNKLFVSFLTDASRAEFTIVDRLMEILLRLSGGDHAALWRHDVQGEWAWLTLTAGPFEIN